MAAQLRTMEGNKVREFVCIKTFEKLAKRSKTGMNRQQSRPDEIVTFAADQSIKSFFQELKVFGKVTCQLSTVPKSRMAVKTQPNTPTEIVPKTTLYKVTEKREVNIKLADDSDTCDIWGSCITDASFLLLADNNNSNLKRLNMTTETVTAYHSLIAPPKAVCQVRKTEAAVSLLNNIAQFVLLGDQMSVTRTLTFNHNCWGLAHHNGKLFISDNGNSVYIHDMNGKESKKIIHRVSGINIFRGPIFRATRHIAVSANGNKVFVASWGQGLITLDIQGNYLSTRSESEIQAWDCRGVCTDGSNVLVCGWESDNVVQIGQDHKLVGQIATITEPQSVCFDSPKKRLYVTKYGNNITVL